MHFLSPMAIKTTELDEDTVLVSIFNKSVLHDYSKVHFSFLCYEILLAHTVSEKMSCPTDGSVDTTKDGNNGEISPKFDICDILDLGDIPHVVLDSDTSGLVHQVVMLQGHMRLGQHIISELRAQLKQEKLVK